MVRALGVAAFALIASSCDASRERRGRDAAILAEAPPPADAPPADAPAAVRVVPRWVPQPGVSSTVTFDADLDFDLNLGGLDIVTSTKQHKRKLVELVAVDADGTVHKRVTYQQQTDTVMNGKPHVRDPDPLLGNTYRVTWKNGVIGAQRGNGKPATTAEVEAVRAEEGQMQSPEYFSSQLAGVRLVEGVPHDLPLVAIDQFITGSYRPRRVVLTYRGEVDGLHQVVAQASLANEGEAMKLFVDLDADVLFDRSGWCVEVDATVQVRAEQGGVVVGSGAGTGVVKATPLRPSRP